MIIDEYLISIGSEVTFSEMYYDNPEFQSSLNKIFEAGTNIHEIKNIITEESNSRLINAIVIEKSLYLLDLMDEYEGTDSLYLALDKFQNEIQSAKELNSDEKINLLIAVDIARNSDEYWHGPNNNTTYGRGGNIAGAGGALLSLTSGAVAWGSMFGPWRGIGVYLGGAAAASIIAALD